MRSYLSSTIAQRFAAKGLDELRKAHAHDWLLWEAGTWSPPRNATVVLSRPAEAHGAPGGEGLALALEANDRTAKQVTLGRGPDCDLSINDGTLSQLHLVFMRTGTGWTVRDAGSKNGSKVNGAALKPGAPVELKAGAQLLAGLVLLTYYDSQGLFERLRSR